MKESIQDLLQDLQKKCIENDEQLQKDLGLSMAEFHFIVASLTVPDLNIRKLQETMSVSQSRMSRIIDSLVNHNYICRETNTTDRRAIAIKFTPKGKEIVSKITEHKKKCEEKIEKVLSHEQKRQICNDLRFLIKNI
ncbi:MAG: MarR family winged helix-turn-helix transcriptional regulator [Bacteroidales bacterium]